MSGIDATPGVSNRTNNARKSSGDTNDTDEDEMFVVADEGAADAKAASEKQLVDSEHRDRRSDEDCGQGHMVKGSDREEATGSKITDGDGFCRKVTSDERFSQRAKSRAERETQYKREFSTMRSARQSAEKLSVVFCVKGRETADDGGFMKNDFLSILKSIREKDRSASPRVTNKNRLEVIVESLEQEAKVKMWTTISGIEVTRLQSRNAALWGRIENVHTQLTEEDLLKELRNQGIVQVRRVTYTGFMYDKDGTRCATKRNTDKVDLQFESVIMPSVEIVGCHHTVTLKSPAPRQCMKCLKYGHIKAECKEDTEVCIRCSQKGHMASACQNEVRCVNCHLNHHALSASCAVHQIWAKAGAARYESRVTQQMSAKAVIANVNEETRTSSSAQNQPSSGSSQDKSYASVARKLIDAQENVLCMLPATRPFAVKKPTSTQKNDRPAGGKELTRDTISKQVTWKVDPLLKVVRKLLSRFSEMVKKHSEKFPEMVMMTEILEEMSNFFVLINDVCC